VLTGCKFTAKGRGSDDLSEFLGVMNNVRRGAAPLVYRQPSSTQLLNILRDNAGLDIAEEEINPMAKQMDEMRRKMDKQFADFTEYQQQLQQRNREVNREEMEQIVRQAMAYQMQQQQQQQQQRAVATPQNQSTSFLDNIPVAEIAMGVATSVAGSMFATSTSSDSGSMLDTLLTVGKCILSPKEILYQAGPFVGKHAMNFALKNFLGF